MATAQIEQQNFIETITTTAAKGALISATRYGTEINPDAALWQALGVVFRHPGYFIADYINQYGLEHYQRELQSKVVHKIGELSVDPQG